MNIWIDIDEVLAATFSSVLPYAREKYAIPFEYESLTEHDWWKDPICTIPRAESIHMFHYCINTYSRDATLLPMAGSSEGIARLKQAGHTLFAITGRDEALAEATSEWLEIFFPNTFESTHFTSYAGDTPLKKSDICHRLKVTHMIEDNMDFATDLINNGICVYLLEKPWNRHRTEVHENLIRIRDWSEIPHHSFL